MDMIKYSDLGLKVNLNTYQMTWDGNTVEVYAYLPYLDKYDLIMIALQKADEDGIYNELKLDMYFHLYLVYMYTNISFSPEDKQDEEKLYDELLSTGFIDKLITTMDEEEYKYLVDMLNDIKKDKMKFSVTAAAVIKSLINDLPKNAEAAAKMVEEFEPEKYERVVNFAKSAGFQSV